MFICHSTETFHLPFELFICHSDSRCSFAIRTFHLPFGFEMFICHSKFFICHSHSRCSFAIRIRTFHLPFRASKFAPLKKVKNRNDLQLCDLTNSSYKLYIHHAYVYNQKATISRIGPEIQSLDRNFTRLDENISLAILSGRV